MDIKTVASFLLIGHLISVVFICLVLRKQIKLARRKEIEMRNQRRNLLTLSLILLVGNFIPILIDILTLTAHLKRNTPSVIGVIYGFSNCFLLIAAAVGFWVIYRYAEKSTRKGQ